MGLDSVEILMTLEEHFGIELMEEEVFNTKTPRMLADVILSKLNKTDDEVCRTQRAFYIIRNALIKTFNISRGSVYPDANLTELEPTPDEYTFWSQLGIALSARSWPEHSRPKRLRRKIDRYALLLACVTFLFVFLYTSSLLVCAASSFLFLVFWYWLAYKVTEKDKMLSIA